MAIKDTIDLRGIPTTGASAQFAERVPARSAVAVERLVAAGAIVIGKTNTHELGYGAICAPTRNARDPARLPGASSGGSAVAVAAGMAYGALGTDTGGSIRIPASFNGVVGMKPTFGLVPTTGAMPLCPLLDHVGPIARTVSDTALLLRVLTVSPTPPRPGPAVRIGVPREARAAPHTPGVRRAFGDALARLSGLGHELVEVDLPDLALAPAIEAALVLHEAAKIYEPELIRSPERFGADVRELLERGRSLSPKRYAEAWCGRARLRVAVRRAFEDQGLDMLATPTVEGTAPPADTSAELLVERIPASACVAFNLTGQPALTVPCGSDEAGMPVGLTLAGPADRDLLVLRVADAYCRAEAGCGVRTRPAG